MSQIPKRGELFPDKLWVLWLFTSLRAFVQPENRQGGLSWDRGWHQEKEKPVEPSVPTLDSRLFPPSVCWVRSVQELGRKGRLILPWFQGTKDTKYARKEPAISTPLENKVIQVQLKQQSSPKPAWCLFRWNDQSLPICTTKQRGNRLW